MFFFFLTALEIITVKTKLNEFQNLDKNMFNVDTQKQKDTIPESNELKVIVIDEEGNEIPFEIYGYDVAVNS